MPLAAGTRLGVYQVQAALGAGGIGRGVSGAGYTLGRDVAIKVLSPGFAEDAERLARFEREARVLASLNHPHIAAIYGVEEGGGVLALVLELVEGETLADRLAHGAGRTPPRLPVADALALARQIADALDVAHEKGIVHRDLKPGNVMVTPAGVVKVLDFGLAKAGDGATAADLTHSPTMTVHATGTGVLLGTAAYMSPEQARGQVMDKRTDIWAFGCVLYELLTGKKAFAGATLSDTLAAILEREPDWSVLPAATPARVRQLLHRCLAKQPDRRIRDIGDALLDLDEPADDAEPLTATQARGTRHRVSLWRVAAAAVLVAAGVIGCPDVAEGPDRARGGTDGRTDDTSDIGSLVFGRQATSGANTEPDWWWVSVEGGEAVRTGAYERFKLHRIRLSNTDSYPYPQAWTADGVLFAAESGAGDARNLWVIALDPRSGRPTGDPARLTNGTTMDEVATMARGGQIVFSAQTVVRATFAIPLDANAGRPTGVLRRVRDDTGATGRTSVSEDGRLLALSTYALDAGGLWVRDLGTGQERQLAATPRTPLNPVMSADGRWAAYTVTKVETGGNAGPGDGYVVATDRGAPRKVCESCQIDLWSRDNQQVVISDPARSALVRIDIATGTRIPLVAAAAGSLDRPMFAPNGRWFTFNSANQGVYVAPVHADRASAESEWTKVIDTNSAERTAGMSPDGRLLFVLLERDGFRCLYAMRLDPSTGQPRGEPFEVAHFHDATRRWGSTGMARPSQAGCSWPTSSKRPATSG